MECEMAPHKENRYAYQTQEDRPELEGRQRGSD